MPSSLSTDLRERAVFAIEEGASRHRAAARFGVSAASASRWHGQFAREGGVASRQQGGDRRSQHIEAHAALILRLYEDDPEIFLSELCEALAAHGVRTSTSALSPAGNPRRRHRETARVSASCCGGLCVPRYFFDVHNTIHPEWDDDETECADGAAIETQARDAANSRVTDHDSRAAPITVSVMDEHSTIVLTVTLASDGLRFDWGKSPKSTA